MQYNQSPQVIRTVPKRNETNIATGLTPIILEFSIDLDQGHIAGNILLHDAQGNLVDVDVSYEARIITVVPRLPLEPGIQYQVTVIGDGDFSNESVTGVRNVFGVSLTGQYTFSFTTTTVGTLPAPKTAFPVHQSIVKGKPLFQWEVVTDAVGYEIQVSTSNTLVPLLFPDPYIPSIFHETQANINVEMTDGLYYWRVRALTGDMLKGRWSDIQSFYIESGTVSPVVEEDTIPPQVEIPYDIYEGLEVLTSFPKQDAANVDLKLKTVYFQLQGHIDEKDISLEMRGESVTGEEDIPEDGIVDGTLTVVHQMDGTTLVSFVIRSLE